MKKKLSASHLRAKVTWVNNSQKFSDDKGRGLLILEFGRIILSAYFYGLIRTCDAGSDKWRYRTISREAMINEEIRGKELRVIDTDGNQLGVMPREEAMRLAEEKKLDLVCISPKANPPVCKILDYGKYKYELQKKEKEAKKKQKTTQVKEIRLSTFIEDHDIMVKAKTGAKFLKEGDKLKVSLRFRGREKDYVARGMEVMDKFAEAVSDVGDIDKKPNFEGRSLTMILSPKSDK